MAEEARKVDTGGETHHSSNGMGTSGDWTRLLPKSEVLNPPGEFRERLDTFFVFDKTGDQGVGAVQPPFRVKPMLMGRAALEIVLDESTFQVENRMARH